MYIWRSVTKALHRSMSTSISILPPSPIPLLTSVASYRQWRQRAFDEGKSVGFVPTMGALHDGHLSLVQRSLAENELTVLSIFVNPAQFAPHEDLATYPRTLPGDLELLTAQQVTVGETVRKASAIFLPSVQDMYPSGISQDVSTQKGAFVEMKGYGHQMEGASRPTFFRGVVTIVTKLFNVVQVRGPLRKTQLNLTTTVAYKCVFRSERYSASLTSSETLQGPAFPTPRS